MLINIKTWSLHSSVLLEFQIKPCKAKIELLKNKMTALILCHNRAVMALEEDILLPEIKMEVITKVFWWNCDHQDEILSCLSFDRRNSCSKEVMLQTQWLMWTHEQNNLGLWSFESWKEQFCIHLQLSFLCYAAIQAHTLMHEHLHF